MRAARARADAAWDHEWVIWERHWVMDDGPEKDTCGVNLEQALRRATELDDEARDCYLRQQAQWEHVRALIDMIKADVTLNDGMWGDNLLAFIEATHWRAFGGSDKGLKGYFPHPDEEEARARV